MNYIKYNIIYFKNYNQNKKKNFIKYIYYIKNCIFYYFIYKYINMII